MKNPAFSQKTTTLPKKLPEFNICECGGHQLTFGLLDLGLADIEANKDTILLMKKTFLFPEYSPSQKDYLNSTFVNLEVNS